MILVLDTLFCKEFLDRDLRPGIGPDDGRVQWSPALLVPDHGCLTLVRDPHSGQALAQAQVLGTQSRGHCCNALEIKSNNILISSQPFFAGET